MKLLTSAQTLADAMRTAGFTHYQFMATLDRRTCARCGERDGEVYKLSEMNQDENAPPMHARCRCTIVAYLDGVGKGERVAGRQRLPEGVTYKQWRARYVDGLPTAASNAKVGLSAGDKASALGASGISPYYIGSIDFKDAAQIKRVLDYYEPLIVKELVENAIIITRSGDIYHCTGTLNDLDTIVELGDKLRGAIVTHNHPIGSDNDYSFSLKDRYLFENYKLARLRGIDEKFIYELNRNSEDIDNIVTLENADEYTFRHGQVVDFALTKGFGYRRWLR